MALVVLVIEGVRYIYDGMAVKCWTIITILSWFFVEVKWPF
jgi:hypothetical protein